MVRRRKGGNTSNQKRGEHGVHSCWSCDRAHCTEQHRLVIADICAFSFSSFATFRTEDPAERAVQMMMGIIGESK